MLTLRSRPGTALLSTDTLASLLQGQNLLPTQGLRSGCSLCLGHCSPPLLTSSPSCNTSLSSHVASSERPFSNPPSDPDVCSHPGTTALSPLFIVPSLGYCPRLLTKMWSPCCQLCPWAGHSSWHLAPGGCLWSQGQGTVAQDSTHEEGSAGAKLAAGRAVGFTRKPGGWGTLRLRRPEGSEQVSSRNVPGSFLRAEVIGKQTNEHPKRSKTRWK